jgi:hypothetical protein
MKIAVKSSSLRLVKHKTLHSNFHLYVITEANVYSGVISQNIVICIATYLYLNQIQRLRGLRGALASEDQRSEPRQ